MASGFSVTLTCDVCKHTKTITLATDLAKKEFKGYKCDECGNPLDWWISAVTATHDAADIGNFVSLVNVMTVRGVVASSTPT